MSPSLTPTKLNSVEIAATEALYWRKRGFSIHLTNGCFDILHAGHVKMLQQAAYGGMSILMVGVNCDESVRALKGPGRPRNPVEARMDVLIALRSVDYVFPFKGPRFTHAIQQICPDEYFKGGDYVDDGALDPDEREMLASLKTKIRILDKVEGYSTTSILNGTDQETPG